MNINISHLSVLKKIEEEIRQARLAEKSGSMKQHIYTVRTLCDMLLDEPDKAGTGVVRPEPQPISSQVTQQPAQPAFNQAEKLQTDDGANGDSIFDF
ncbi:YwdI family protein [Pseudobacillus badius]|uniref:YwdI family protein n=1 Tax=Bacillus badius TaxID=1455 RepID=UPI0007B05056|nr:YwdI family protein [Bacillus badius]KZN99892.1 hypothetical protein A4244_03040 [Bacillus badius]OCS86062.1 hypothetical protein A6M11_03040 [Bacillus badius]OVE52475.1 hypothetical protein B1A98_08840 [Bacillus badius]TDW04226.1 hypothetical protein B0G66_103527 [Bacillus badius]